MPEVTEEQILEYIRLIELAEAAANAELRPAGSEPIEAATDPYEYYDMPDEDAVRKAARILNSEDARVRGMLSDDMRAKLESAGPSMLMTEHPDSHAGYQTQPPGLEDIMIDPANVGLGSITKDTPFVSPYGGAWYGNERGQNWGINPGWVIDDPKTGRPYWGTEGTYERKGPQGTARGVVEHELAHGVDDAMVEDTTPEFHKWTTPVLMEDGTVGRRFYLKSGTGQRVWSAVDEFGKEFMSRGAARIQDVDDEVARGGRLNTNAQERFAGLMMHVFDTGVVPTSFGDEFYEFVKGFMPNVKQEYLGLDKVDPRESPYDAYVRLRKERDEGTGTTAQQVDRAWKRFLFSVDSRDETRGLYDTGKARYVKAEGGPLNGFESGEWTSDTDISGKWTPVVAKPDLYSDPQELDFDTRTQMILDRGLYYIEPGDTLSELSKRFGMSVGDLKANIWPGEYTGERQRDPNNPDKIYENDIIVFPPESEQSWNLDKSDPSVIGEFGEIQQGESEGQDWVKQEMDVEQLHRLTRAWEDQQKAGVGKGFLDRLKSDPGFYMEVPPGADYDPGFTMQPPPGGWPDIDPGFYIR